nr:unnamed protein product [Digitaria exilis]
MEQCVVHNAQVPKLESIEEEGSPVDKWPPTLVRPPEDPNGPQRRRWSSAEISNSKVLLPSAAALVDAANTIGASHDHILAAVHSAVNVQTCEEQRSGDIVLVRDLRGGWDRAGLPAWEPGADAGRRGVLQISGAGAGRPHPPPAISLCNATMDPVLSSGVHPPRSSSSDGSPAAVAPCAEMARDVWLGEAVPELLRWAFALKIQRSCELQAFFSGSPRHHGVILQGCNPPTIAEFRQNSELNNDWYSAQHEPPDELHGVFPDGAGPLPEASRGYEQLSPRPPPPPQKQSSLEEQPLDISIGSRDLSHTPSDEANS